MTRIKRLALVALAALSLSAGGLAMAGADHAEARMCVTNRCQPDGHP